MEQIQRSLEQFLDREVARYEKQESMNTERSYISVEEYPEDEYSEDEYSEEEYPEEEYPEDEYPEDGYLGEEYSEEKYPEDEYPDEDYSAEDYSGNEYPEDESHEEEYTNRRYRRDPFPEEEYGDNPQERYVRHGKKEAKRKNAGPSFPDRTGPEPGKPPKKQKPEKEKGGGMKGNKGASGKKKNSVGKKKSGFRKFLTLLIVLLAVLGGIWYVMVGHIYGKMRYGRVETLAGEPLKEQGVVNILLIGSDSRTAGDEGRSDAMILLSISDKTRTIHMTSLLRDMYVDIPGREGNRLNAAYSFGGPELLLETVKQNLGIDVNRYAVVNFQAFANLVDAVNGVDMELTNDEVKWVNAYLNEYNELAACR